MRRILSDREVIGYLISVITVLEVPLDSLGKLETQVAGNGPTLRQMIDQARSAAKTNTIEVG